MRRILLVATLIAVAMFVVKDERVLARIGLLGTCTVVASPEGDAAEWWACRDGKLSGRPDLSLKSCVAQGVRGGREYWRCPAPVGSGPSVR